MYYLHTVALLAGLTGLSMAGAKHQAGGVGQSWLNGRVKVEALTA